MIKYITRFILAFALFSYSFTPCVANDADKPGSVTKVRISKRKPFSQQVTRSNTVYVIRNTIDLKGETVEMPDNSILLFKKGVIRNGTLRGNYEIQASNRQAFENVNITSYKFPVKFVWMVGNRKELYETDFINLPRSLVDFEGIEYVAKGPISLDKLEGFHFESLNLRISDRFHYWQTPLNNGLCAPVGGRKNYNGRIEIQEAVPDSYLGYMIEVSTADETKYDSRPDENGIPTLYKGITSRISYIEGKTLQITDSVEFFSKERLYNGHKVTAQYRIYKPRSFKLTNCHFVFSNKSGISLRGCDFLIENCVFESTDGSNSIVSLGGHTGYVRNCTIRGAYYPDTHTSYGIQVVKGTNIIIEGCQFYENRRGVDFSGGYESRYNVVQDCSFFQEKNEGKTGSAIGGHSTSFGNAFKNNKIYGEYQVGIQCRGENEIIDGNIFYCSAVRMISFAYNTVICNNIVETTSKYAVGVFAGSGVEVEGNTLRVYNNTIDVRKTLISGDKNIRYLIKDNTFNYKPNASSIEPVVFSIEPNNYEMTNNQFNCSRGDTKVKFVSGGRKMNIKE